MQKRLLCAKGLTHEGLPSQDREVVLPEEAVFSWASRSDARYAMMGSDDPLRETPAAVAALERYGGCVFYPHCPQFLEFQGTAIDDDGFAVVAEIDRSRVTGVYLNHTRITDASLALLGDCPRLRELDLACTAVTDNQ